MEEKLLKIAKFADNPNEAQFEELLDLSDTLTEVQAQLSEMVSQVTDKIQSIPKPVDYTEKFQEVFDKLEDQEEIVVSLNII
jgi:vacuolar-type H+-ATPase subunit E/Vma4